MTTTTSSRSSGPHATAQRLPITSDSLKDHGNSRNAQDVLQSRLISCFSDVDDSCGPASHRHSAAFRGNEYNGPNVIRSWSPPYSEANDAGATDNRDGLGQDHQEIVGSPRVSNSSMPRGDQGKPDLQSTILCSTTMTWNSHCLSSICFVFSRS